MAVTIVIGLAIAAAAINGLAFTSHNKATVQSRSAAEAGIADARVKLPVSGSCPSIFESTAIPRYSATVSYLDPYGDIVACADASQVRVISQGQAETPGLGGTSSSSSSSVEAIFPYTPASSPGVGVTGAGIYLGAGASFNNGGTIASTGAVPAIQVKTGNLTCDNNTGVIGSVVVVAGNMSLKKCTVTGDAWVYGQAVLLTEGKVTGELRASTKPAAASGYGTWNPTAPMPPVPPWAEFGYNKSDWVTNTGVQFDEVKVPASSNSCVLPQDNGDNPVIFNALDCAGIVGSGDVTLKNDLVIVAKKFTFGNQMDFVSSIPGVIRRVWFITPDLVPTDNQATCSAGQGDFAVGNNFAAGDILGIATSVSAMLYTPCGIDSGNGFTWRGQMYAGSINSWNNALFGYVGVGLPGTDLSTGVVTPGGSSGSTAKLGELLSSRDLG